MKQVFPAGGAAANDSTPMQAVLVLGGVGTGRRSAEIIPAPPGTVVFGFDYPYKGPRTATPGNLLLNMGKIRRAATATTRGFTAALAYLLDLPNMDPRSVVVIGASFGGSFVIKALSELPRERDAQGRDLGPVGVRAACILFWGAGQPDMARYRMRERPWWEREAIAWLLQLGYSDLEPEKKIGSISPRPLLLINGEDDEFISEESARRLEQAAGDPKMQIWLPGRHLQPDAEELLKELVEMSLGWLAGMEAKPDSIEPPGNSR